MKKGKDSLGDRMKENYENRAKTYLTRRTPVVLRCDGKSFHSYTKYLKKPYDKIFHAAMNDTMQYLCKNIQGCKLGYTQSDEITLLLTDFDTLTTDAWFDYSVQKLCSVSASMATLAFNKAFRKHSKDILLKVIESDFPYSGRSATCSEEERDYAAALEKCIDKGAMFDARCFNIPESEVTNCLLWRQQDATRNAVQMLGQCYFSHKELDEKSQNEIQEMLFTLKGINFNNMPAEFKRGVCCIKNEEGKWILDKEIPIFSQNRDYIEKTFIREEKP